MERGFYHPDRGYWQVTNEPPQRVLDSYPEGTQRVPLKPGANYEFQNGEWVYVEPPPRPAPDRVSSRQFKMQLEIAGIRSQVETWVSQQDPLVQIAYANSGTFVRDEQMMAQGFADLGFTEQQIDDFFTAAAAL